MSTLQATGGLLPPVETLEELLEAAVAATEKELPLLEPGGDIVLSTVIAAETARFLVVHPFADSAEQDAIYTVLPELMAKLSAWGYMTTMSAWTLPEGAPMPGEPGYVEPREHPDHGEGIMIFGCDGVRQLSASRSVGRDADDHPVWADDEWTRREVLVDDTEASIGGTMVEGLDATLRMIRLSRASRLLLSERPEEWWTEERRAAMHVVNEALNAWDSGSVPSPELLEAHRTLGSYHVDPDGSRHLPTDLLELAARDDLWRIPPNLEREEEMWKM